jgi:hypothetical protein
LNDPILSDGPEDYGGFFDFRGKWQALKNKGIKWLTKFPDGQNASRVKAVGIKDKLFLIF